MCATAAEPGMLDGMDLWELLPNKTANMECYFYVISMVDFFRADTGPTVVARWSIAAPIIEHGFRIKL